MQQGALLVKILTTTTCGAAAQTGTTEGTGLRSEQRQKDLLAVNGIPQQDYDAALNAVNSLEADIDLAKAQIAGRPRSAPFTGVVACAT